MLFAQKKCQNQLKNEFIIKSQLQGDHWNNLRPESSFPLFAIVVVFDSFRVFNNCICHETKLLEICRAAGQLATGSGELGIH